MRKFSAFVIGAVLLSGCAGMETFAAPEVSLVNMKFSDATVFETSGHFVVRITNQNNDPVVVDGGVYNIYLNGGRIGKGMSSERIEVPRLGNATTDVEIFVSNLALATRLVSLMDEPILNYRVKGKLYVERPYGRRGIKFSRDGRLDLNETLDLGRDADSLLSTVPPPTPQ